MSVPGTKILHPLVASNLSILILTVPQEQHLLPSGMRVTWLSPKLMKLLILLLTQVPSSRTYSLLGISVNPTHSFFFFNPTHS